MPPTSFPRGASVLLVDRDPLAMLSLRDTLHRDGYETSLAPSLACVRECLSSLAHPRGRGGRVAPRAALIAPCLSGHETGVRVAQLLRRLSPKTGRVLLTERVPAWIDARMLRWTFHAVARPSHRPAELRLAIEHARTSAVGGQEVDPLWVPVLPTHLTTREREIVTLRLKRRTYSEIARLFGVTNDCVKKHCTSARAKLGCERTESLEDALARWRGGAGPASLR